MYVVDNGRTKQAGCVGGMDKANAILCIEYMKYDLIFHTDRSPG